MENNGCVENIVENTAAAVAEESVEQRLSSALKEYARRIDSVRNDVFTATWWQLAVNFALGFGAIGCLVASMFTKGATMAATAIAGVVLALVTIIFNYVLRSLLPSGFLQYTYIDRKKGKRYTFAVLSKTRVMYCDGASVIECDRNEAAVLEKQPFEIYAFDFFADMRPIERMTDGDRESFKGVKVHDGKEYRCKITFRSGVPVFATVGGVRIKYFDVNNTKDKFVVPATLKRAAKLLDIPFPKLPGLYVKDDVADLTKQ